MFFFTSLMRRFYNRLLLIRTIMLKMMLDYQGSRHVVRVGTAGGRVFKVYS